MTVGLVKNVLTQKQESLVQSSERFAAPRPTMPRELQNRFIAIILFFVTLGAIIFAGINLHVEDRYQVPYDGVWWIEHREGTRAWLEAKRVDTNGPGDNAGVREGDRLISINGVEVTSFPRLVQQQFHNGDWKFKEAPYSVARRGVPVDVKVILQPADRSLNLGLRLIALVYLLIGLYILMRRWTAPKSLHFYLFCLVSFIFYSFKYTGKLNAFDEVIYWSNAVAWLLQPALFLHFALTFPEEREIVKRRPWIQWAIYTPGM